MKHVKLFLKILPFVKMVGLVGLVLFLFIEKPVIKISSKGIVLSYPQTKKVESKTENGLWRHIEDYREKMIES